MLSQSILESRHTELHFDLNVQSINYYGNEQMQLEQAFLYLADTLCSAYQDAVKPSNTINCALDKLKACCRQLNTTRGCYIWAYHDIDEMYRTAVRQAADKAYFQALFTIHSIRQIGTEVSAFYDREWLCPLENVISKEQSPDDLKIAFIRLGDYLSSPKYNLQASAAIHAVLKSQWTNLPEDKQNDASLLFSMYKTEMTIRNHMGDCDGAEAVYHDAIRHAKYVSVEDYL